jgi:hypothetical protein
MMLGLEVQSRRQNCGFPNANDNGRPDFPWHVPDRARRTADSIATVALIHPLLGFESDAFAPPLLLHASRWRGPRYCPGWSAGRGRVRVARVNYALLCPRELVDKQMANANLIYFGFRSSVVLNSKEYK